MIGTGVRINWNKKGEAFVGVVILFAILQTQIVDAVRLSSESGSAPKTDDTGQLHRTKRSFGSGLTLDFQKAWNAVMSAPAISNHITGAFLFNGIILVGWVVGALVYELVLSFDMTDETRATIRQLDFMFAPTDAAISFGRVLRNDIFAMVGRILFDLVTDPAGTYQELTSITFQEIRDRAVDDTFLTTFLGRFIYQFGWLFILIWVLGSIGEAERDSGRKKRNVWEGFVGSPQEYFNNDVAMKMLNSACTTLGQSEFEINTTVFF